MPRKRGQVFGVAGTITHDFITLPSGRSFSGLGGILYQAAALCGLGKEVSLFSNIGQKLVPMVNKVTSKWPGCKTRGLRVVKGPGNRVRLRYPARGERIEVLESCVPPLDPEGLIDESSRLGLLITVINSGRDFTFEAWRKIVAGFKQPIWLDIHSLPLAFVLRQPRTYQPLTRWRDWVEGVTYLQANEKEVASMLGDPDVLPSPANLRRFGQEALELGLEAVFVTLGRRGVLVMSAGLSRILEPPAVRGIVDTTGCGDVFCAAAAAGLESGADPVEAARSGIRLAAPAAGICGIEKTYTLVRDSSAGAAR